MDVTKYVESRNAGNAELKRYGESFQCVKRQFDPETGAEIVPSVATFTEQELRNQQAHCQKMLDSVNAMIADMEALKNK